MPVLDPEGAHLAALQRLGDFRGQRVLEMGCGDGRLTVPLASDAAHVLAFDADAEAVERARHALPAELRERVVYRVASAKQIELDPHSFDLVVFSLVALMSRSGGRRARPGSDGRGSHAGGHVVDLQVIRPNPVVEVDGRVVCEIDGEPLFISADEATAAVDDLVRRVALIEEAIDDHDVREHYAGGTDLVSTWATKRRQLPRDELPALRALARPCAVRERCRLRRLRVQ